MTGNSASLWQRLLELSATPILHTGQTELTPARLVVALLLWLAFWGLAGWSERAIRRVGNRRNVQTAGVIYTTSRLARYAIAVFGVLLVLSVVGVDLSALALVGGAVGVGIGLGLQGLFNNIISGLILLAERTLRVGDWIELASGPAGELREIGVRYSRLRDSDDVAIMVPNTELIMQRVANTTRHERRRRLHVPFRLPVEADKARVAAAAESAAAQVPGVLMDGINPVEAWLVGIEPGVLAFELVVWIADGAVERPSATRARLLWALDDALRANGVDRSLPARSLSDLGDRREGLPL